MISKEERIKLAEDQIKNDFANKDAGSFSGKSVFNFEKIGGYRKDLFYKPKVSSNEINRIEILPYLATEKNPQKIPVGVPSYKLEYWVHRFVGASKSSFLCLTKMYGKPCPICEEREELMRDPTISQKEIDALKPKSRFFYNVLDKTSDNPIQIFDESHFLFQKELLVAAGSGGRVVIFADIELGKIIEFIALEKRSDKGKFTEYRQFTFLDRKPYDERIYRQTYVLDDLLVIPTYEDVRDAYLNIDSSEEHKINNQEQVKEIKPNPFSQEMLVCPSGHNFGVDFEKSRDCFTCPGELYKNCQKEK